MCFSNLISYKIYQNSFSQSLVFEEVVLMNSTSQKLDLSAISFSSIGFFFLKMMFSNGVIFNIFVLTLLKYIYQENNQTQKAFSPEKNQLRL
jgi:hypothetical protein